ncbi:MAG: four helix bundle protein [Pyrinomonadaceae bacterium]
MCAKNYQARRKPSINQTAEVIGNQLLRNSTSVAANYRAACRSRSTAEFISKIGIVEEERRISFRDGDAGRIRNYTLRADRKALGRRHAVNQNLGIVDKNGSRRKVKAVIAQIPHSAFRIPHLSNIATFR